MGATKKSITTQYLNNSATGTTVATKSVDSEMVMVTTKIDGTTKPVEIADQKQVYPGVIGGQKPAN